MSKLGLLRPIKESELELMLSWRNNPSIRSNMYTRHIIDRKEHQAWYENMLLRDDQIYFMYEYLGGADGIIAFKDIDRANKNSSWIFYANPLARKGTGAKIEFLALDFAFLNMKLNKLYCEVLGFNSSVIKLHGKFGFKVEGNFREQHKKESRFVDVVRLGLLASEWMEQRELMKNKIINIL